jgi:GDP-4-dehydro-6-deoxy-D-mannose reductase
MKRYFITGAQGFLGRHVISSLLSSDGSAEVLGAGRSVRLSGAFTHSVSWGTRRIPAPLPDYLRSVLETERYRYVSLDLRRGPELIGVLRRFRPEVVIHLASAMRDDPLSSLLASTIECTIGLMEALPASCVSVRKVVICSTGGVYGAPAELPIREEAPCNPIDFYSTSKLAAEHYSRILARQHQIPAVWVRLFNLVGPGQDERHICGSLVAQAAAIAEGVAPPVMQIGALDTTRDFVDPRDAASALLLIAENGISGSIYNVASGGESPMQRVLQIVLQAAGLAGRVKVEQAAFRAADVPRHFASIERLRSLGFGRHYDLVGSIKDLLHYYRRTVKAAAESAADKQIGAT